VWNKGSTVAFECISAFQAPLEINPSIYPLTATFSKFPPSKIIAHSCKL